MWPMLILVISWCTCTKLVLYLMPHMFFHHTSKLAPVSLNKHLCDNKETKLLFFSQMHADSQSTFPVCSKYRKDLITLIN